MSVLAALRVKGVKNEGKGKDQGGEGVKNESG